MRFFPIIAWHRPGRHNKWCAQEECASIDEARDMVSRRTASFGPGGGAIAAMILTDREYDQLVHDRTNNILPAI